MNQIVVYIICAIGFVICTPHNHKNKEHLDGKNDFMWENSRSVDNMHYKDGEHNNEFDHEAVLGSRDEAEKFDQLPPEESKKRLGVIAEKMDVNNDKYVDAKELTKWVLRSFK